MMCNIRFVFLNPFVSHHLGCSLYGNTMGDHDGLEGTAQAVESPEGNLFDTGFSAVLVNHVCKAGGKPSARHFRSNKQFWDTAFRTVPFSSTVSGS